MRRFITLILLAFSLLIPVNVQAQAVEIDIMQIDIWPEYDRPEALIIYRFTLTDSTPLPATLTMRLPAASGGPYNIALKDSDGQLYNLEYTTEKQEEWILVNFTAPSAELQIEFYDPSLKRSGNRREFNFNWPADYTVRSLSVQIQQPVNASQMQIEPDLGAGQVLQDGLTYYIGVFGQIEAGEAFDISLTYEKPDEELSAGFEAVFPAEPITGSTQQNTFMGILPWVLGGLGALLVLGVVIWYLAPQRDKQLEKRKRHSSSSPTDTAGSGGAFCHQCGARCQPGDKFCRTCGAKLHGG